MHFNIQLGRYNFAPRWTFLILALIFMSLFIFLGTWQLHRAEEKERLQAAYDYRLQTAPLKLNQLDSLKDIQFYRLLLQGRYDNAHTILVDNKVYQGRVGYEVVTPFSPLDNDRLVLVNRGWIAGGSSRDHLPYVKPMLGIITIEGVIYVPTKKPFVLSQKEEAITWPWRVQAIEFSRIETILKRPVYPFIMQLGANDVSGFVRNWKPVASPSYKHLGYAVQWFALALALLIIFFFLNLRKNR